jgi:hypothetical protein
MGGTPFRKGENLDLVVPAVSEDQNKSVLGFLRPFGKLKRRDFYEPILPPIIEVDTPESPDTKLFLVSPVDSVATVDNSVITPIESLYIFPDNIDKNKEIYQDLKMILLIENSLKVHFSRIQASVHSFVRV